MNRVLLFSFVAFIPLLTSCDNESADPNNSAPSIQFISADPPSLKVNESTTLTCVASDPDGDNLTYAWSADKGFFTNGDADSTITWTAPNEVGSFVIKVSVNDGKLTDQKEDTILVFEDGIGILEGIVYKINSTTTISGVLVEVGGQSFTTGEGGTYKIENIPTGEISIKATMNDYKTYIQTIAIMANQTTTHHIYMVNGTNACDGDSTVTHAEKTYNTVQIGEQCWLKENLNIGTMIARNSINDNQTDNNTIEKFCFDNDEKNCDANGGLYQWNEAMQYITTEGSQGLCPAGWHVPTQSDFDILINTVGGSGNALKALGQGAGTNTSGFTALLAGHRDHNDGLSHAQGDDTIFWGSSESNGEGNSIDLYKNSNSIFSSNYHKEHGFSIRCVKD